MKNAYQKLERLSKRTHELALRSFEVKMMEGEMKRSKKQDLICSLGFLKTQLTDIINELES